MNETDVSPEILRVLRSMELFQGKDSDELTEWLGMAPFEGGAEGTLQQVSAGERMIEAGSFGNSFYLLIDGTVGVFLGPERLQLATLQPGSFFGEMTLISGQERSADVIALESCLVIEVPRRAFEQ